MRYWMAAEFSSRNVMSTISYEARDMDFKKAVVWTPSGDVRSAHNKSMWHRSDDQNGISPAMCQRPGLARSVDISIATCLDSGNCDNLGESIGALGLSPQQHDKAWRPGLSPARLRRGTRLVRIGTKRPLHAHFVGMNARLGNM
jgi:hypothetical protein